MSLDKDHISADVIEYRDNPVFREFINHQHNFLTNLKIIPHPFMEENTIYCHPKLYKLIAEAVNKANEDKPNIR